MSDLGAIGTYRQLGYPNPRSIRFADSGWTVAPLHKSLVGLGKGLGVWAEDHRTLCTIPSDGVMSGTVKENGVAIPYAWVALYYRKNGQLIARTKATEAGVFSFQYLEPGVNEYYAVAIHGPFNALIFDAIEAV